jgi:hypothetical protein
MGSWIMESISYRNQIYLDLLVLNHLTYVEAQLLNSIIRLMGSFIAWPKVIPLCGVHCISFLMMLICLLLLVGYRN